MAITHSKTSGSIPPKINGTDWDADHVVAGLSLNASTSYLGYNTIGGTAFAATTGRLYLRKITPTVDTIILAVEVYAKGNAEGVNASVATVVLSDASGTPRTSLRVGAVNNFWDRINGTGGLDPRWFGADMAPLFVAAGTSVWIGAAASAVYVDFYSDASGSDKYHQSTSMDVVGDAGYFTITDAGVHYSIRALCMAASSGDTSVVSLIEPAADPDADDDEGAGADTDPISGWTTLGTVTTLDRDTTFADRIFLEVPANGGTRVDGAYKSHALADNEAFVARIDGSTIRTNYNRLGIFHGESGGTGKVETMNYLYNSGALQWEALAFTTPTSFSGTLGNSTIGVVSPLYLAIRRNSSTSYDYLYGIASPLGLVWSSPVAARNPSFTQNICGFFVGSQSGVAVKGVFKWFRFYAALPAALAP